MGEEADAMEDLGIQAQEDYANGIADRRFADSHHRLVPDQKQEKQFRRSAPARECPCIVPGCAKKFRPTTDYTAFLVHYQQKHGGKK